MISRSRRQLMLGSGATAAVLAMPAFLRAQSAPVKIKFQLDWRADGQSAPFFFAQSQGYFAQEGLDVSFDVGGGSSMAIGRVASGAYDMGYGDLNSLIEFLGNGAEAPTRPVAVYQTLESTPAGAMMLANSNIARPADLAGKTLGAPVFDAGRKLWPLFAKVQGLAPDAVKWQSMDPALREVMLVKGQVDAVTGFQPSGVISAVAAGAKEEDLRVFLYKDFGVNVYGNAVLASSRFIAEQPQAVSAFLRAYNRGLKEVIARPDASIASVKARDPIIDVAVETRRLKGLLDGFVVTPTTRAEGLGGIDMKRLAVQVEDVSKAFNLKTVPGIDGLFNASFLPPKRDRMLA